MYQITYKNVLKSNKKLNDFETWLHHYWPILKTWSAVCAKIWISRDSEDKMVYCRYTIENLDIWNQQAMSQESEKLVEDLGSVVDLKKQSIKIHAFPDRHSGLKN